MRLLAAMSKSLAAMPPCYACTHLRCQERQTPLVEYLEDDPFVSSALSSAFCELCYYYGMSYLAPLTAAITSPQLSTVSDPKALLKFLSLHTKMQ